MTVPMVEVVRAFNWVIEKGWVSAVLLRCMNDLTDAIGVLLGDFRVDGT